MNEDDLTEDMKAALAGIANAIESEFEELREMIAELTARVEELEARQ